MELLPIDKHMSTPTSIRITEEGMKALKVLETTLKKSRAEIVSDALIEKQQGVTSQPPVQLRRLDPAEYLTLQADLASLQQLHDENRKLALKKRPTTKEAADATAATVTRIDEETTRIMALRQRIAKEASLSLIAKESQPVLRTLSRWATNRLEKATDDNQRRAFELELKIINLLQP